MAKTAGKVRKRTWRNAKGEQTAWIADYFDQHEKRHIKTFERQKDAKAWLEEAKQEIRQGVHTPERESPTVAVAGESWIAQAETDGLERSTVRQYRQHLDLHIRPLIGGTKLSELTAAGTKEFRNRLLKEGRSPQMTKKIVVSLGAILANAMDDGRVARNVVREQARQSRRRSGQEKRNRRSLKVGVDVPSNEEVQAMLAEARGRWRPLFVTATFTGMRASELRGLAWDDVDFKRKIIHVRQRANLWGEIGAPKSEAGHREIPMSPMVANALREWRLACPKGVANFVFPNGKGNVESHGNIANRGFYEVQRAAGIVGEDGKPKYGLHALRHFFASWAIERGFTAKRVQALLGHSSIQMTFDVYGHLFPSLEDDHAKFAAGELAVIGR